MIGVAVIGAGIGAQHLAAYAMMPDLYAMRLIVDRDVARATPLAQTYGTPAAADISAALQDPSIDVIDICLPPQLHVPVTLQALAAGKHVICEKPLATSLADAHTVQKAAKQAGKHVFPVFQYRFGQAFSDLQTLIDAGLAGRPKAASLETHWARDADYYANGWRGTWATECGGAILCHAIHVHDLLAHFFGPISAVTAHVSTLINPIETEDTAAVTFRMQNGALATSSVCLGAAQDETRMRLIFEKLTATSGTTPYNPGAGGWRFVARDPSDQPAIDAALAAADAVPSGFEGFLKSVATTLKTGAPAAVDLADGIASVELVTAIYHAARTDRSVALPLSSTHPLTKGWHP
ncbi:MAG: Gfo/Idh/MocA family protein [Roseobacter sp.]